MTILIFLTFRIKNSKLKTILALAQMSIKYF